MKKLLFITFVILVAACSFAHANNNDEHQIRQTLNGVTDGWATKNFNKVQSFYAENAKFISGNLEPWSMEDLIEFAKSSDEWNVIGFEISNITLNGNTATAVAIISTTDKMAKKVQEYYLLERTDNGWKITQESDIPI